MAKIFIHPSPRQFGAGSGQQPSKRKRKNTRNELDDLRLAALAGPHLDPAGRAPPSASPLPDLRKSQGVCGPPKIIGAQSSYIRVMRIFVIPLRRRRHDESFVSIAIRRRLG